MQNFRTIHIPGRARLYCRHSAVIFPEERGYIAGIVQLYSWKRAVILLEERGFIEEERSYIARRARLYFRNEN